MLAERSGEPRPWLFYRDGIDWQWLSYRQAAVRVTRTAEALAKAPRTEGAVSIRPDFDIDTLVVRMAARHVGVELRDASLDGARESAANTFVPPPAPKHFEAIPATEGLASVDAKLPFTDRDSAEALLDLVRTGASVDGKSRAGHRPVVFAAPGAGPGTDFLEALASVSLALDAGWALEPMAAAFVATARWVRPTILIAPPLALDALAEVWDGDDRRWSRLEAVVVAGNSPSEGRIEHWGKVFGCRIGIWSPLPPGAASSIRSS